MEPNNFEKDFRDKLNERKIEPSNKAWDRLDAMLTVAEENKPKAGLHSTSKRKWLYIAASFIGFLLVGTFFFNQNKNNTIENPKTLVVEKEAEQETNSKQVQDNIDSVKTEIADSEKTATESVKQEKNNNQILNKTIKNESNQIAESSIIINNNQEKQAVNNQTVIAETVKNQNVEQLLVTAENKVVAENPTKKTKVKVNASDLLNQVDGELELSFREKMITKVNKNFQEVKVAVTNRNKQD